MATAPLLDFDFLRAQPVLYDLDEIRKRNRQRYEMEQLSAIVYLNPDEGLVAGYKEITENEFWVRGHIPERPLMPGVIMLEAGAQVSSFYFYTVFPDAPFFGFAAIDEAKFRGMVVPGQRLYLLAKALQMKPRRAYFQTQGMVDGKIVFEARLLGIALDGK